MLFDNRRWIEKGDCNTLMLQPPCFHINRALSKLRGKQFPAGRRVYCRPGLAVTALSKMSAAKVA